MVEALSKRNDLEIGQEKDGDSALQSIRNEPHVLLILDQLHPGMSGLAMIQEIRKDSQLRAMKIFMVTASRAEARALDAGANAFLLKPFRMDHFMATVEKLVAPEKNS